MANTFLSGSHNSVYVYFQVKKAKPADAFPHISGGTAAGSSAVQMKRGKRKERGKGRRIASPVQMHLPQHIWLSTDTALVKGCFCSKQQRRAEKEGNGKESTSSSSLLFGRKLAFLRGTCAPILVPKKMHLLDYQEKGKDTSMHYCSSTKST